MKYHFSWIGVTLLTSTLATSVSAKHYTFYAPITEQVVVHTAEQSDQWKTVTKSPFFTDAWTYSKEVDLSNISVGNLKKHRSFFEHRAFCIAPEVDGNPMKQTVETHHPFAHFLFKENFINSHEEASYSKSFVQIPYFTGTIDKTPHMITEIRMFSFNHTSPIVCDAKENFWNDTLRTLYKNIETGDQLTLHIQYPVGTNVSSKFLSPLQSAQTYTVTSNESSNPHITKIRMLLYGICFAEDGCEVERVVLTDLDGKTRDYTEEVQEFKKYMRTYTFVDGGYMIPKNTASITFTYKKIPAEK